MRRFFFLTLPLFLVVSLLPADPPARAKKLALLAGVNNYDGTGFRDLNHTVRDMEKLRDELEKLGFEVVLKTNQGAKKKAIDEALADLLKKREAGDLLLVALSGHGEQTTNTQGKEDAFFCPRDVEKGHSDTMVSLTEMVKTMGSKGVNLLLVDACRNDPGKGAKGIQGDELEGKLQKNTAVLFSCSAGQESFETTRMYGETSREGHGVFFYHVLEGLRGGAKDGDDEVTWDSLVGYVRKNVNVRAKEWLDDLARNKARDKGVDVGDLKFQTPHVLSNLQDGVTFLDRGSPPGPRTTKGERQEEFEYYQEGKTGKAKRRVVTLDLGGGVKMDFVRIPKGKFQMGSPKGEEGHSDDEDQHEVEITRDYYLAKYHVTRGQFRAFVTADGYKTEAETDGKGSYGWNPDKETFEQNKDYNWKNVGFAQTDEHPVLCVSWNDAEAFCKWLSKKTGKAVRLPHEAEWEYACRAGSTTRFYCGDDQETLARVGNVADGTAKKKFKDWSWAIAAEDGYVFTAPAGKFAANRFGLHDMHGNAWQWCADWYGPYSDLQRENPLRIESVKDKEYRVLRGGSWFGTPLYCRAASRGGSAPSYRNGYYGFRVAFRLD